MKSIFSIAAAFLLVTTYAQAEAAKSSDAVQVMPCQAVIQIKGVVCSFCAYGTEKNLSKLDFLNKSQFGEDGVLMDIHTHRITQALERSQQLDMFRIFEAIKDGGYDPVTIYLNLHGKVSREGSRYLLTCPESGQMFTLSGQGVEKLVDKGLVNVRSYLDATLITDLAKGQPVPLVISE